jgi:hypothetical protein
VYVQTGKEKFSGTDSNVFIRLFDDKNQSTNEYQLTHYNWKPEADEFPIRNLFETNARDQFIIKTEDISMITKIYVSRH